MLEGDFENDLKRVIISLRNIGNKAVQKKMDNVASTALNELKYLSDIALDKNFSNAMWSFSKAAQEIGKGAVQVEMLEPAKLAIDTLKMIGMGAVEKKMEVVTLWTTMPFFQLLNVSLHFSFLHDSFKIYETVDVLDFPEYFSLTGSFDSGFEFLCKGFQPFVYVFSFIYNLNKSRTDYNCIRSGVSNFCSLLSC